MTKRPYIRGHVTLREAIPYIRRQVEIKTTDLCIRGFMGVTLPWDEAKAKPKIKMAPVDIGHVCGGTEIEKCRTYYEGHAGPGALAQACRMCRGPQ